MSGVWTAIQVRKGGCRMAKAQYTQKAILHSFRELLKEKSFCAISIEDICEKAGASRRTFYRYFTDKYELFIWIYQDDCQLLERVYQEEQTENYLKRACAVFWKDRMFYRKAFLVDGQNSFEEYYRQELKRHLLHHYQVIAENRMADIFVDHITGAVLDALKGWLGEENPLSIEQFLRQLWYTIGMLGGKIYFYHKKQESVSTFS